VSGRSGMCGRGRLCSRASVGQQNNRTQASNWAQLRYIGSSRRLTKPHFARLTSHAVPTQQFTASSEQCECVCVHHSRNINSTEDSECFKFKILFYKREENQMRTSFALFTHSFWLYLMNTLKQLKLQPLYLCGCVRRQAGQ
jgi:hypothetical protein